MPVISRFYGIVIKMFFKPKEHNPSHVHAVYGDYLGAFDVKTGEVLHGDLPRKAVNHIQEWISLNRDELEKMWEAQRVWKLPPLE